MFRLLSACLATVIAFGTVSVVPQAAVSAAVPEPVAPTVDSSGVVTWIAEDASWAYQSASASGAPSHWPTTDRWSTEVAAGPAPLGFGEGDEATTLPFDAKSITAYFTTSFDAATHGARDLVLRLRRDDGAIVYLNGTEVVRTNLPAGVVTPTTRALAAASDDGRRWRTFAVDPGLLVDGRNTLSVEVHQNSSGSSDLTFAAQLSSTIAGHQSGITSPDGIWQAWSPRYDGDYYESFALLRNTETGHVTVVPRVVNIHGAPAMEFSPDSRQLAYREAGGWWDKGATGVINLATGQVTRTRIGNAPMNYRFAWAPDSSAIASATSGGLAIYDLATDSFETLSCATVMDPLEEQDCLGDDDYWMVVPVPRWSPDGAEVRFTNHRRFFIADRASGEVRRPTNQDLIPETVVSPGAQWAYRDTRTPESNWRTSDFTAHWPSGPAELGYGDGDEATVIAGGLSSRDRPLTAYFRTAVRVGQGTGAGPVDHARLRYRRDDGVAIYLGGNEIVRSNLPSGTLQPTTLALAPASDDGSRWREVRIDALGTGNHVLAAEVHQSSAGSSDLSFDAELVVYRFRY